MGVMKTLSYKCGSLPIDLVFELFDKMVVPIWAYDAEIWEGVYQDKIESVHRSFCKCIIAYILKFLHKHPLQQPWEDVVDYLYVSLI